MFSCFLFLFSLFQIILQISSWCVTVILMATIASQLLPVSNCFDLVVKFSSMFLGYYKPIEFSATSVFYMCPPNSVSVSGSSTCVCMVGFLSSGHGKTLTCTTCRPGSYFNDSSCTLAPVGETCCVFVIVGHYLILI